METKHTQGEWKVSEQSNYQFAITSQNHAICFIPKASPNVEANAKLIASAPDLLDALLSALPYLHKGTRIKAELAINKATN